MKSLKNLALIATVLFSLKQNAQPNNNDNNINVISNLLINNTGIGGPNGPNGAPININLVQQIKPAIINKPKINVQSKPINKAKAPQIVKLNKPVVKLSPKKQTIQKPKPSAQIVKTNNPVKKTTTQNPQVINVSDNNYENQGEANTSLSNADSNTGIQSVNLNYNTNLEQNIQNINTSYSPKIETKINTPTINSLSLNVSSNKSVTISKKSNYKKSKAVFNKWQKLKRNSIGRLAHNHKKNKFKVDLCFNWS